jgi:phosphoribosyl-ATP pyrophosphohydrolase/phosphoribosyl-AMP cyclohydrolase
MDERKPMVVCDQDGLLQDVVGQTRKGYTKTLEQGEVWAPHPESDRVLPYREGVPARIEDKGRWYLAHLQEGRRADPPDRAETQVTSAAPSEPGDIGEVLDQLVNMIASRHSQMPEGSYTTHLFTSGSGQIRKKVGEEAIEVVLAPDRSALVREIADLLYHILVLLESDGIPLSEVASELRSR